MSSCAIPEFKTVLKAALQNGAKVVVQKHKWDE
jgi:hypothetical protein